MNKIKNKFKYLYALIFFASIAIIVVVVRQAGNSDISSNKKNIINYQYEWNVVNGSEEEVSINCLIDLEMIENKYLFFRSSNKIVEIYVDEEKTYEYGDNSVLFPLSEWTWHIVEIDKDYLGKTLRISSYEEPVDKINLCKDRTAIFAYVMLNEIPSIIVSFLFIFISVMLLFIWILTRNIIRNNKVLYLTILAFLVSIGFLINTRVVRLLIENHELLNTISSEIIMLIPMAIILHYLGDSDKKLPGIVKIMPVINFVICNTLYLTKTLSFSDILLVTNVFLVFESLIFTVSYIYNQLTERDKDKKKANIGFIIMVICIIIDLTKYHFIQSSDYFNISRVGILFYISTLAYDVIVEILNLFIIGKNAELYKRLAYNDILTGVYNRFAFEEEMEKINKFHYKYKQGLLIMIDINNLKFINDTYGHEDGDKYIVKNINYVKDKVKSLGNIYRTGGDEFIILASCKDEEELVRIFKGLEEEILRNSNKINFAYGFAAYDENVDKNIYDTLKRADKNMYDKKKFIKEKDGYK